MHPAVRNIVMSGYDPAAEALFLRFSTPATPARKVHINRLISTLRAAGIWSKMDCFYIMAAETAQAAQRNWVEDRYNLTPVNAPTFEADRGYTGNATTQHLGTGFVPSTATGRFTLNHAHFGVWCRTNSAASVVDMGCRDATTTAQTLLQLRTATDVIAHRVSQGANGSGTNGHTDSSGHHMARRPDSAATQQYWNGASTAVNSGVIVSSTLCQYEFVIAALNTAGTISAWSARQYAAAHIGAALSVAENTVLYNALNTYMVAVGAA
jgi:hypothetical protein